MVDQVSTPTVQGTTIDTQRRSSPASSVSGSETQNTNDSTTDKTDSTSNSSSAKDESQERTDNNINNYINRYIKEQMFRQMKFPKNRAAKAEGQNLVVYEGNTPNNSDSKYLWNEGTKCQYCRVLFTTSIRRCHDGRYLWNGGSNSNDIAGASSLHLSEPAEAGHILLGIGQWNKSYTAMDAMKALDFPEEECKNKSMQKRVRREKIKQMKDSPPLIIETVVNGTPAARGGSGNSVTVKCNRGLQRQQVYLYHRMISRPQLLLLFFTFGLSQLNSQFQKEINRLTVASLLKLAKEDNSRSTRQRQSDSRSSNDRLRPTIDSSLIRLHNKDTNGQAKQSISIQGPHHKFPGLYISASTLLVTPSSQGHIDAHHLITKTKRRHAINAITTDEDEKTARHQRHHNNQRSPLCHIKSPY
eukprot:jgi/Psemu1/31466/gm1.31466_g